MSNVTPIRSGDNGSGTLMPPKKDRKPRKPKAGLLLFESGEFDGFTTQDVVNALHGVCSALDLLAVSYTGHYETVGELSTAAKVLSSLVQTRVASPKEVRL